MSFILLKVSVGYTQFYFDAAINVNGRTLSPSVGIYYDLKFDTTKALTLKSGAIIQKFNTSFIGVDDIYLQIPIYFKVRITEGCALVLGAMYSKNILPGETSKKRLTTKSTGGLIGLECYFDKFTVSFIGNIGNKIYYSSYVETWYFDRYYIDHSIDQFKFALGYKLY